jgi:PBSX family phage terminase large subunit
MDFLMPTIALTKPQTTFFKSKARYNLFCGGYGSGKSEALYVKLMAEKMLRPKVDIGVFAPTFDLIRIISYPRILNLLDQMSLSYQLNKSENILYIDNYGKILFRSMEIPERLVGFEIFSAYVEELDTMRATTADDAWTRLIARCRAVDPDHPTDTNHIEVATTPEGYRFCYSRWGKDNKNPDYHIIKAPTASNPHLPADYIRSLRESYPPQLIEAYLEGEFVNLNTKSVYPNFDRRFNSTKRIVQPGDHLHIGCDFNVMNMNAIVHILEDGKPRAVAELVKMNDTPHMIETIKYKYPNHSISIYPDASGRSRKSVDASKSDISQLRDAYFNVIAPNKNPPVKDRTQSMNAQFENALGERHYQVNVETCPEYTSALEIQSYDRNGVPEKDPKNSIDDINDSAGYFIHSQFPINRRQFAAHSVGV